MTWSIADKLIGLCYIFFTLIYNVVSTGFYPERNKKMENLKSKENNSIEVLKMPSIEEQQKLLQTILNHVCKDIDYVGVSQEDYDSISMFAKEAFEYMVKENKHAFVLMQVIVKNNFKSINSNPAHYYLLLEPIDFILTNQLGYKFLSEESRWVKVKNEKSINLTELFSDVINLSMQKHYQHICSQIEKDYTECKDILSSDKLRAIYLSNPNSIGNVKDNYIILKASNKEEALKKATLQVADNIEEWMFDMFDLDKVQNKFFKSVSKINGHYIFEKAA